MFLQPHEQVFSCEGGAYLANIHNLAAFTSVGQDHSATRVLLITASRPTDRVGVIKVIVSVCRFASVEPETWHTSERHT